MHRPTALLALSGALALAAESSSTTVDLWLPILGDLQELKATPVPLSASVVGADAKATTYALGCPGGTDEDECPSVSFTFVQGPSTYAFQVDSAIEGGALSETVSCTPQAEPDTIICTGTLAESNGQTAVVRHETITTSGFVSDRLPVTLTAGLEKLSATPGSGATNTGTGKDAQSSASDSSSGGDASPTSTSGANPGILINLQGAVLIGMAAIIGSLML